MKTAWKLECAWLWARHARRPRKRVEGRRGLPVRRGSHSVLRPNGTRTPEVQSQQPLAESAQERIVTKRVSLGEPSEAATSKAAKRVNGKRRERDLPAFFYFYRPQRDLRQSRRRPHCLQFD